MAIDSSIALQAKLPTFDNPLTQYAQVAAIQNAQNQNQLAQYTISKAQRGDADELEVRNALTGAGGDLEKGKNALYSRGLYKQAGEIGKTQLEQQKTQSEIGKNNADAGKKVQETSEAKRQQAVQDMASFETPADALASLQHHAAKGDIDPQQAQLMAQNIPTDPAQFAKWQVGMLRKLMAPKDQVALTTPDANAQLSANTSLATTGMNNRTALAANGATVGATMRGQDMSQATAVRGQDLTNERALETLDTKREENKIKREEAGGKLTEFQGKSTGFAARAQEADRLISSLDGKYSPAAINSKSSVESVPGIGGMMGAAVNKFSLSPSDQKAEQAQRDFINSILRQESGAAIGASEFDNARKQYFTQPGDDAGTIAQKATNRRLAIEGLRTSAGPGAKQIDGMVETSNKPAVKRVEEAVKNGTSGKLASLKPISIQTAADYAKLPSGTVYTAPDGSQRTKQ